MTTVRMQPQNIEAEHAVLGAILQGGKTPSLSPEDFYRPAHGLLFNAMLTLEAKGEPIDYLTVKAELERLEKLQEVGGVSYISGLTEQVPVTAHIDCYA
ncbi:MAG: replicative DNA helicase, partial [Deltaproteobacteria bacterium]